MRRDTYRYYLVVGMLVAAVGLSLLSYRGLPLGARPSASPTSTHERYVFHTDLAGWYQSTPDERVTISPFNLNADSLPESLPLALAGWRGEELGTDDEIERWFQSPDMVMRRSYLDDADHQLWLTAVSSRGPKSFHIFEHTPQSCYPSAGWGIRSDDVLNIPLQRGDLAVRRGVFDLDHKTQVVYYWYQWDSPDRDAGRGVSTWRLTAEVTDDLISTEARMVEFMQVLFVETLPWHRF